LQPGSEQAREFESSEQALRERSQTERPEEQPELDMGRYTIPETFLGPEFHIRTYQYIGLLHPFIFSHFSDGIALFHFYEVGFTGTSRFPFRALGTSNTEELHPVLLLRCFRYSKRGKSVVTVFVWKKSILK
jgi:hypothetical protein